MAWRLYDTTVFVDYFRGREPGRSLVAAVRSGEREGAFSVITLMEMYAGTRNARERLDVGAILAFFEVREVTRQVAEVAGALLSGQSPAEIQRRRRDAIIAATAITHNETILTADAASGRAFGTLVRYDVYNTTSP